MDQIKCSLAADILSISISQPDSQLQMARRDPPHLQILGSVPSQLENLVGKIQNLITGLGSNLQPGEVKLQGVFFNWPPP